MADSVFITNFLQEISFPRFSAEEPPRSPALIELLAGTKDSEIAETSEPEGSCVRTLLLISAGAIDEAHEMVQELPIIDGAYIHGIIHRIDADFDNARYWFRRAGVHPSAMEMYRRAASSGLTMSNQTKWDPIWATDLLEKSEFGARSERLRAILLIEFEVLLEFLCSERSEVRHIEKTLS